MTRGVHFVFVFCSGVLVTLGVIGGAMGAWWAWALGIFCGVFMGRLAWRGR